MRALESTLGIKPSPDWIETCPASSTDDLLHQILHADLRSVVRGRGRPQGHSLDEALTCDKARFSQTPLLLQIEEVTNIAQGAEARLSESRGGGCLLLCLTHGHSPTPVLGLVLSSLPELTQASPGCKLLLHQPVDIRHGRLLLHEGNAAVLGGQVPALVQLQQQALQQAQQAAGVGVDATVRALVSHAAMEAEEPQDEAHEASGDVPALPTPTPPASRTVPPPTRPAALTASRPPLLEQTNERLSAVPSNPYSSNKTTNVVQTPILDASTSSSTAQNVPSTASSNVSSSRQSLPNPYNSNARISTSHHPSPPPSTTVSVNSNSCHSQRPPQTASTHSTNPTSSETIDLITPTHQDTTFFQTPKTPFSQLLQKLQSPHRLTPDTTWTISLQKQGGQMEFNIDKRKVQGHKIYEFTVHATFGQPGESQVVACKLPSALVEPFFEKSPVRCVCAEWCSLPVLTLLFVPLDSPNSVP